MELRIYGITELRIYGIMDLWNYGITDNSKLKAEKYYYITTLQCGFAIATPDNKTTRLLVGGGRNYGITEGFASASPDYETTSQQDNECGFASASQTTDNRTWASPGFARRLRRHVVYKK